MKTADADKIHGWIETPEIVVNFIIEHIFSVLISNGSIDTTNFSTFTRTFGEITFFDPAIGRGNFILGLIGFLNKYLKAKFKSDDVFPFLRNFVANNIFGLEIQKELLWQCKNRLIKNFPFLKLNDLLNLQLGDTIIEEDIYQFFNPEELKSIQPVNWHQQFLHKKFDVVFGNPPYFSIKKNALLHREGKILFYYLKHSKKWKNFFRSSGSDIYHFFILRALEITKNGGIISFIIPNYWLENEHSSFLREKLITYKIIDIIDFGKILVFTQNKRKVHINSCILTLQKAKSDKSFVVIKISKWPLEHKEIQEYQCEKFQRFNVEKSSLGQKKWVLSPHLKLIREIEQRSLYLSHYATVIQGLSPGVKSIFVIDSRTKEKEKIEDEVLVHFVSNRHIQKWKIKDHLWAIMPRKVANIEDYPNAIAYLKRHYKELTTGPDRKRLIEKKRIKWYDYSVYRNLQKITQAPVKILTPYRSINCRFAFDDKKLFFATDAYAIIPKRDEDIFFILAVLNSSVFEFWYKEAGKRKGAFMEFFSKALQYAPIPYKAEEDRITPLVKEILKASEDERTNLEREIDAQITSLFKIKIPKSLLLSH